MNSLVCNCSVYPFAWNRVCDEFTGLQLLRLPGFCWWAVSAWRNFSSCRVQHLLAHQTLGPAMALAMGFAKHLP